MAGPQALADPAILDDFIARFLLNAQLANGQVSNTTRGFAALTIMQSAGLGSGATGGLFASNFR